MAERGQEILSPDQVLGQPPERDRGASCPPHLCFAEIQRYRLDFLHFLIEKQSCSQFAGLRRSDVDSRFWKKRIRGDFEDDADVVLRKLARETIAIFLSQFSSLYHSLSQLLAGHASTWQILHTQDARCCICQQCLQDGLRLKSPYLHVLLACLAVTVLVESLSFSVPVRVADREKEPKVHENWMKFAGIMRCRLSVQL